MLRENRIRKSKLQIQHVKEIVQAYRNHHHRSSTKKDLKKITKFIGKTICAGVFFNKVAGLSPATLLKKKLLHRCFLVNFANNLRAHILQNTCGACF